MQYIIRIAEKYTRIKENAPSRAFTKGVPELDGSVTGTGDDLAVVGREGNGEDIAGVAAEDAGGVASRKFPQAQSLTYTVGHDVGVALKASLGVTVGLVVAGQVPDDQGLVATGGKEHVGAIDDAIAISKNALSRTSRFRRECW
ncbi:hypothetical protein EIK77_003867 [Talaromyces pinophilus]|nr:hypothetical protein EIK77_003867 [Talaromyces pinophilus]